MDALAALRGSPRASAVFVDFDGTLAPIVAVAEDARPLPGVPELLEALTATFGVVAIVSGRPVAFLRRHLPQAVELHGLYGLESAVRGEISSHPDAVAWRPVVEVVAAEAVDVLTPAGVDVEDKGLSLTLHFRRRPDGNGAARRWATDAAKRSGLVVRSAKMSVELHPPLAVDKGTVVQARSAGMSAACYVGDDEGDLPAFAACDHLSEAGLRTLKVAVHTPDASPELLARADLEVDGPQGAVAFLRDLR